MGSGKTSAAIQYINAHPDGRFIYVTPYLDEVSRIREACPSAGFIEPSNSIAAFHHRKSEHLIALMRSGHNIVTTHASFSRVDDATLGAIRDGRYTLIVDEDVDMVEATSIAPEDMRAAVGAGYIAEDGGVFTRTGEPYAGSVFSGLLSKLDYGEVIRYDDETGELFCWTLSSALISSFDTVFILTYLFEGQVFCQYLRANGVSFDYIGVARSESDGFLFSFEPPVPTPIPQLRSLVDILDRPKLNEIGDHRAALSIQWFRRHSARSDQIAELKRNLTNLYKNIYICPQAQRLCGMCSEAAKKAGGAGYTRSIIAFNIKATNKYAHCTHLAYVANVFLNPNVSAFLRGRGFPVDEDVYALSVMIQWIWRSAIRNGQPIHIYVPSRRMRELLVDWIDSVSTGEDFSSIRSQRRLGLRPAA